MNQIGMTNGGSDGSSLNSSGNDTEKLMENISILKNLNDEIISTVVDRLALADDNVARLVKENDSLRQLLKEMHDHEPKMKNELLSALKVKETNFAKQLQDKDEEIEKWRTAYEELAQNGGGGGNNEEVTKLQTKLKFMETRLKALLVQLDNKTKENEELSNMMNDLCGQQV